MVRLISLLTIGAACVLATSTAGAQGRGGRTATGAGADGERLICRRIQDTGSLVRTVRQCFTRAEWDRIAETARRGAQSTISGLSETSISN